MSGIDSRNLAEHRARQRAVKRGIAQAKFSHLSFEELRAEVVRCNEGDCEWASMYRRAIDPLNEESKYIHETMEYFKSRRESYVALEAKLTALEAVAGELYAALEAECAWCRANVPLHWNLPQFHRVPCEKRPCNRETYVNGEHWHMETCKLSALARTALAHAQSLGLVVK